MAAATEMSMEAAVTAALPQPDNIFHIKSRTKKDPKGLSRNSPRHFNLTPIGSFKLLLTGSKYPAF